MNTNYYTASVFLFLLSACSDTADLRRWELATTARADERELDVQLSLTPATRTTAAARITTLSDRAQAELVRAIDRRTPRTSSIQVETFAWGTGNRAAPPPHDMTDMQMAINVFRPFSSRGPGDRIERISIGIQPINFAFGSYRNATIEMTAANSIDVERQNTSSTTTTLGGTIPTAVPINTNIESTLTRGVTSNTTIRLTRGLNAFFRSACAEIYRTGSQNFDIDGNMIFDVKILTESGVMPNPDLTRPCGAFPAIANDVNSPQLTAYWVVSDPIPFRASRPQIPGQNAPGNIMRYPARSLAANISVQFEIRHVFFGRRNITEGEQWIQRRIGSWNRCVDLEFESQSSPNFFRLEYSQNGSSIPIYISGHGVNPMPIIFTDFRTAQLFASWLQNFRPNQFGHLRFGNLPSNTDIPISAAAFYTTRESTCNVIRNSQ